MTPTGKRHVYSSNSQDEVIIEYEFSNLDKERCEAFDINPLLGIGQWQKLVREGIRENEYEVWMHPFRFNQYAFTEVAPLPEIAYPLKIGLAWTGGLDIGEGWGIWANSHGVFSYEVIDNTDLNVPFGEIENCWEIASVSNYRFGKSYLNYWFNKELGFVKFHYVNYADQELVIELVEVEYL